MKKWVIAAFVAALMAANTEGSNFKLMMLTLDFDTAQIKMPDGSALEVRVKAWCTADGGRIQVETPDGTVYMTHAANVVLVKKGGEP